MLSNSLRQPYKRLFLAFCVHSVPFRCCPRDSSERPRCPATMTKPVKLCTLIVLISGESPSQDFKKYLAAPLVLVDDEHVSVWAPHGGACP